MDQIDLNDLFLLEKEYDIDYFTFTVEASQDI